MGPGVPYVIGAKWAHPDRPTIAFVGDGAMQMNGLAELITIKHYWQQWADPRLIIAVLHNNDLNQVTWEMRAMEGSPKFAESQTLPDVDYAAFARSLGLAGINIDDPEAARRRRGSRRCPRTDPTVLDVRCDPNVPPIPPHATFEQIKAAGRRGAARRRGHLGLRQAGAQAEGAAVPARPQGRATDMPAHGRGPATAADLLDTAVHDVRTGRFERTLAALTAAGAAVTAGEIYLSHDGASFGNKMMWWPIVVVPTAIPAGIAAVVSPRAAHTVLPLTLGGDRGQRPAGHLPALARHRATPRRHHPLQPRGRPAAVRAAARLAGRRHGAARRGPAPRGPPAARRDPAGAA